jgi:hypothetical protein
MATNQPVDILEFIPVLLEIIPEDQESLRKALIKYKGEKWNQAPELRVGLLWIEVKNILENHVQPIDADWKTKLVVTFNSQGRSS